MKRKLLATGIIAAMITCSMYGCGNESDSQADGTDTSITQGSSGTDSTSTSTGTKFDIESESIQENEITVAVNVDGEISGTGADVTVESTSDNTIYLGGASATYSGSGVTINGGTVTITNAGTYVVTGTLDDGQIVVDTEDKESVWIILSGVDITSDTNAAIYVTNAKKTIISAASGTTNTLTDSKNYTYAVEADEEPNACIFSKDDLVISGNGALVVNGNFNNGIASKDTLEITNINLTVNSVNNGIKGKDCLIIKSGNITVNSEGDGLKSDNTSDSLLGYILIEGGNVTITAAEDGIQAETCLKITGGTIDITTGNGSGTASTSSFWGGGNTTSDISKKGLKAGIDITITGGKITVDSEDDSLHTNNSIEITGGTMEFSSGDDGIHSDTELVIGGGAINVIKSYEGVESAKIVINDGTVQVVSSDDGINAAGGNDSSAQAGRPGMNNFSSSTGSVEINGGYVYLNASGDGLDSNGSVTVTGGTVIIDGPEDSGNGAFDYDGTFNMSGGILIAAGSSGMLQTISTSSSQYCISTVTTSYQSGGTLFNISDSDGNSIVTYEPSKKYNSVVVCAPNIENGKTYTASVGGSSTGKANENGLYSGGSYSGGTAVGTVTISSIISSIGSGGGMNGGGMNGGPR